MTTTPAPTGRFIQIITDDEPFDWHYTDPATGEEMGTLFQLRVLPESENRRIRAQYTKTKWKNGQKVEDIDWDKVALAQLDAAIVGWKDMKGRNARTGEVSDLPCTIEVKKKLPERLKGEIIRVCVGKETSEVGGGAESEAGES